MSTEMIDRPVVYWDCHDDSEVLCHSTKKSAIESYLDGVSILNETITVYGFARMVVPKPDELNANSLVDEVFEDSHWEEYIGEDGPNITDRMTKAALTFLTVMHEEFVSYACEQVISEEIDIAAWIAENRPDWLKETK